MHFLAICLASVFKEQKWNNVGMAHLSSFLCFSTLRCIKVKEDSLKKTRMIWLQSRTAAAFLIAFQALLSYLLSWPARWDTR